MFDLTVIVLRSQRERCGFGRIDCPQRSRPQSWRGTGSGASGARNEQGISRLPNGLLGILLNSDLPLTSRPPVHRRGLFIFNWELTHKRQSRIVSSPVGVSTGPAGRFPAVG